MKKKISENVYLVGTKDPEREIFDSLVYMPKGTSYNSYIVEGSKYKALIDCADPRTEDELNESLVSQGFSDIDYIILLHAEQDHSGSIYSAMEMFPDAKIACTAKVKEMMQIHFEIDDNKFQIFNQGDILDLGDMKLEFYMIPFAHWPDNTMVYLTPSDILFSSDLFGSHNAFDESASQITDEHYDSARTYYSEIMMPFRKNIAKHVNMVKNISPGMIAPSHGPIWEIPENITKLYDLWTSDFTKPKVTIPYVTMHESTKIAVEYFAEKLSHYGVEVSLKNLSEKTDSLLIKTGEFVYDLVDSAAVVFAFPTVLGGPHPAMVYAAATANAMIPKTGYMGMICSYAWATKAVETVDSITGSFKCKRIEPVLIKGLPKEEDYKKLDEYAKTFADLLFPGGH